MSEPFVWCRRNSYFKKMEDAPAYPTHLSPTGPVVRPEPRKAKSQQVLKSAAESHGDDNIRLPSHSSHKRAESERERDWSFSNDRNCWKTQRRSKWRRTKHCGILPSELPESERVKKCEQSPLRFS